MSARKLPPEKQPPASVADAAERLAAIVEAAEQAASTVIDDAEEQARRQLEEARANADQIAAERLRELADELDPRDSRDGPPRPHLRPVEPDSDFEPAPDASPDGRSRSRAGSSGARLLATQMAVSGASRSEIEQRLRRGFDIEDTNEILDAILGPEE